MCYAAKARVISKECHLYLVQSAVGYFNAFFGPCAAALIEIEIAA
jgi:hypothetical protein